MARPQKKGLEYFPLDVSFFSDKKIKIVRGNYGSDGVLLYIYLLCEIYKNGYYLTFDDDFMYVVSADLGMTSEKIGLMLSFFLKRSLFDGTLFKADKILTSEGIQRRYQEAVKQRALKNPVQVDPKLWLLKKSETRSFIKVRPDDSYSRNNFYNSENNSCNSENNPHKVKYSKVKESKVDKSSVCPHTDSTTYGPHGHVRLTNAQFDELSDKYGKETVLKYADKIDRYIESSGKKPFSNHYDTFINWLEKDNIKPLNSSSFDIKAIEEFAKNHTPEV
ncbi:MAG: DUF4373 domain-containing protein [Ruminococcus sp.]|nr:DUF4373 domain-containing protein [Ruminococcus sp.]